MTTRARKNKLVVALNTLSGRPVDESSLADGRFLRYDETYDRYVHYDIENLDLFVPYEGANRDVDIGNYSLKTASIKFNTSQYTNIPTDGELYWDYINKCLSLPIEGKELNIGEEVWVPLCYNNSGEDIPNGTPVYIDSSYLGYPTIKIASCETYVESRTIGVTTEDILNGSTGRVTRFGYVNDINLSTFAAGDEVFLYETGLTNVRPTGGHFPTSIGKCITPGVNGKLLVYPRIAEYTDELYSHYSGWPVTDSSQSIVTLNNATRTLTITPVDSSFYYYHDGQKYIKTGPQEFQWSNDDGIHIIYYQGEDIVEIVNPTYSQLRYIKENDTGITTIYWSVGLGAYIYANNERHSINMLGGVRAALLDYDGCKILEGIGIIGMTTDASGNLNTSAQFGSEAGVIRNQSILTNIPSKLSTSGYTVYYRFGTTSWRAGYNPGYSVLNIGTGRMAYNQNVGGSWQLTEAPNNSFILMHYYVSNTLGEKIGAVMGQNFYGTISEARANVQSEFNSLLTTGLPIQEFSPLWTVIYETKDSFTNAVKARIVSYSSTAQYYDWRGSGVISSGGSSGTSTTFLGLLDTPSSYAGSANRVVAVSSDETGLVFINLPTIGDGTLTAAASTIGATNTGVTLNFSGLFSANTSTNRTINPIIGPALSNLVSYMTGTSNIGFIKKTAQDTYTVDTNTYLTGTKVDSFSGGTTGLLPSSATTGAITLSGTLNVANGGTGQTSFTNGQLLIGNTTGNTLTKATLTQGTGITINNGAGSISIINSDLGSSQNIFKNIANSAGTNQFSAASNNDTIRFVGAGASSVTFDSGTKSITITSTDTIYTHPTQTAIDTTTLTGANVISRIQVNTLGHTTSVSTRALTLSDLGYTGDSNANFYTLPLAANGTRGGIQIGYTATGANLPLELSSEKAYITLTKSAVENVLTGAITTHTHAYEPTITAGTTSQYWRGDKSWQTLNLNALSDTTIGVLTSGQLLQYNGTAWVNWTPNYLTGNQNISLSGDVTGSGTTSISTTIANNAVTTAKILDANVTFAKIANGSAISVLGRSANTAGVMASITASTNGHVLRRASDTLGFGTIGDSSISDLAYSKLTGVPSTFAPSAHDLTFHSDVIITTPATNQVLQFNGTNWVNATVALGGGTVTSVSAGNGMNFTTITGSGSVTLGTPSNITLSSTNSLTSNSHTHAFVPGGTTSQYIRGDGTLATFPSIPQGTVTSVGLSAPVGFSVTGSPITTNGTLTLDFDIGYSLPTTAKQSNWDTAYSWGNHAGLYEALISKSTGYLRWTGTVWEFKNETYSLSTHNHSGTYEPVISAGTTAQYYRGDKSWQTLNTTAVTEGTNLYFTDTRVRSAVLTGYTATSGTIAATDSVLQAIQKLGFDKHVAVTLGTANGLTLSGQQIGLGTASTSTTGALTSTDWNTFNNKQATISLTTTGNSGASTFNGTTLNVPNYTLAGLGGFANPMTTLGDVIYGAASGTATRLAGNITTTKQYLSQTGNGSASAAPSWSAISGSDVTGAALTKTDDTNVTLTLGGTPTTALLRAASITVGWSGQLAVSRGGTGAGTLTGILVGNGTSAISAVTGTANQLLRRNATNTAYEFFTPSYLISESDPVYTGSSWYTTTNNSTNWDTAYEWGNHAGLYESLITKSVGYLRWTGSAWEFKNETYSLSTHTHGNITNAGAIGSTSGLPIITTTSGVLTTGSFGTSAGTFTEGNDSRLGLFTTQTASLSANTYYKFATKGTGIASGFLQIKIYGSINFSAGVLFSIKDTNAVLSLLEAYNQSYFTTIGYNTSNGEFFFRTGAGLTPGSYTVELRLYNGYNVTLNTIGSHTYSSVNSVGALTYVQTASDAHLNTVNITSGDILLSGDSDYSTYAELLISNSSFVDTVVKIDNNEVWHDGNTTSKVSTNELAPRYKAIETISASNVDWSTGQVFTKTLTGATTLTFSNLHVGVKDLEITGNYTLNLPSGFKVITGEYNGTVANLIQIICTNPTTPTGWVTISQEAV